MMMPWVCPKCGDSHRCVEETGATVEEISPGVTLQTIATPDNPRCWCQHLKSLHHTSMPGKNLCRFCECDGFAKVPDG